MGELSALRRLGESVIRILVRRRTILGLGIAVLAAGAIAAAARIPRARPRIARRRRGIRIMGSPSLRNAGS